MEKDEQPVESLKREVRDKIGIDISQQISNDLSIVIKVDGTRTDRYYIIHQVEICTEFHPHTKGEISVTL